MPSYDLTGLQTVRLLTPGEPGYLFGSKPYNQADTRFYVTNVALTSNVATVTIVVTQGNVPSVGQLITIQGSTSTSGLFNVTNAVITGVSYALTAASGTVTFALTHANVTSAADSGNGIVRVAEVSETLANGTSWALCVGRFAGQDQADADLNRTFQAVCSFPTVPTTATVTLQGAIQNIDSEYVDIGTIATVATGSVTQSAVYVPLQNFAFIRAKVASLAGSGTIVCKVL